ncbi:MAG: hypothetical protein V1736_12245 [Pseudomonadota bacterium]
MDKGGYRLYYMEHGRLCPPGVIGIIASSFSADGYCWQREAGIRIGPVLPCGANRVLAPDIIFLPEGRLRMYFEARTSGMVESILSAVSENGLDWEIEPGVRLRDEMGRTGFGTPCCVLRPGGHGWRLYFHARSETKYEIWSAISSDGLTWEIEHGTRIAQTKPEETYAAYSPYVVPVECGWRMYYSGWQRDPVLRGYILAAISPDGLTWTKEPGRALEPGSALDAVHCSEPCLLRLADGRWRLFYEAQGTDGRWRILGATAVT